MAKRKRKKKQKIKQTSHIVGFVGIFSTYLMKNHIVSIFPTYKGEINFVDGLYLYFCKEKSIRAGPD